MSSSSAAKLSDYLKVARCCAAISSDRSRQGVQSCGDKLLAGVCRGRRWDSAPKLHSTAESSLCQAATGNSLRTVQPNACHETGISAYFARLTTQHSGRQSTERRCCRRAGDREVNRLRLHFARADRRDHHSQACPTKPAMQDHGSVRVATGASGCNVGKRHDLSLLLVASGSRGFADIGVKSDQLVQRRPTSGHLDGRPLKALEEFTSRRERRPCCVHLYKFTFRRVPIQHTSRSP